MAVTAVVVVVFAATVTQAGMVVLAASDHFLLKYSGVFALMLLTGTACMGVLATDRIILTPGNRVVAQAAHRAFAFGTLAFLAVHVTMELTTPYLPQSGTLHVYLLDAFIPFLSQYRTLYMAEGTIASDIIILLIVTGIFRRRYAISSSQARKWRLIHYSNYAALVLGILHGLLAGRKAIGSFVYWSYGGALAMIAVAVLVRVIAASLRPRETTGTGPLAITSSAQPLSPLSGFPVQTGFLSQASNLTPATPRALSATAATEPFSAQPPQPAASPRIQRYEPGYEGPPRYEGAPSRGTRPGTHRRTEPQAPRYVPAENLPRDTQPRYPQNQSWRENTSDPPPYDQARHRRPRHRKPDPEGEY